MELTPRDATAGPRRRHWLLNDSGPEPANTWGSYRHQLVPFDTTAGTAYAHSRLSLPARLRTLGACPRERVGVRFRRIRVVVNVGRGRRVKLVLLGILLAASMVGARVALPGNAVPAAAQNTTSLWAWGFNRLGQVGVGNDNARVPLPQQVVDQPSPVVTFALGAYQSLAATGSGEVWAWGDNRWGQLGNPNTTETCDSPNGVPCSTTPLRVLGLPDPATDPVGAVAGGGWHSLALTASGRVFAWGLNEFGQLGNPEGTVTCPGFGGTTTRPQPCSHTAHQVLGLPPNVTEIAASGGFGQHSLAVTANGQVWAWGLNFSGQLGNGSSTGTPNPVPTPVCTTADTAPPCNGIGLPANDPVVQIAAGEDYSLALTKSGLVWIWGDNSARQLGNGTQVSSNTPGPVCTTADTASPCTGVGLPANDPVVGISAGQQFSVALTESGRVWSWGDNRSGQLGDGEFGPRLTPVQVCTTASAALCPGTGDGLPASDPVIQVAAGPVGGPCGLVRSGGPWLCSI